MTAFSKANFLYSPQKLPQSSALPKYPVSLSPAQGSTSRTY